MFGPSAGEVAIMTVGILAVFVVPAIVVVIAIRSKTELKLAQLKHRSKTTNSNLRYDVFLSYSTSDQISAKKLAQQMMDANLEVFFAEKQLEAGTEFSEEIRQALIESREVWVFATPNSVNSTWVATEWGTAWALEKRIIPVLHNLSPSELPDRLRSVQTVDIARISDEITRAYSRRAIPNDGEEMKILPIALLCLFLGFLGAHRFYVGRWKSGVLQMGVTLLSSIASTPFGLVWPMIDLVFILLGKFTDKNGRLLKIWL